MTLRPEPYEGYSSDRVFDALEALEREAADRGVSMAALALAWALAQPELTGIVIGPGRADHLAPALEALDIDLSPDRPRPSDGGVLVSVLVLSEHDVRALLDMESCIDGDGGHPGPARARRADEPAAPPDARRRARPPWG